MNQHLVWFYNYTQLYKDAFQAKISEIENKEASDTALVQQKQMTQDLYLLGENFRKPLKSLRIRIERSGIPSNLTVKILKDIKVRNFEGVSQKLGDLVSLVTENSVTLQSKGMKDSMLQDLQNLRTAIAAKADQQTQLMKKVASIVANNKGLYDELYQFISEICEDGKLIFEDEQKAEEYTIKKMLAKLHANKIQTVQEKQ